MLNVTIDSNLSYFLERALGSAPDVSTLDTFALDYQSGFDYISDLPNGVSFSLVSLASTKVALEDAASGHTLTFTGSGITPTSSLDDLIAAIDGGVASGAFSKIVLKGPRAEGERTVTLLTFDVSPTGYVMTSGDQVLNVTGSLPASIEGFIEISDLLGAVDNIDFLSGAEVNQLITDLRAFGISGISLTNGGTEVFGFGLTATSLSLSFDGFTIALSGTFPDDLGELLDVVLTIDDLGAAFTSLSQISGLALNGLTITGPDDTVLLNATGNITNEASVEINTLTLDGKTIISGGVEVANVILGNDDPDFFNNIFLDYADTLTGTSGDDHIYGLGGRDTLYGGAGNDSLFGGSGNDVLYGGTGNDLLNPGDNDGYDVIYASTGDDTFDFGQVVEGYVELSYTPMSAGITVSLNGLTNTGSVLKGSGAGTDTLIDLVNPMTAGAIYATGGLGIYGTMHNDTFNLVTNASGWTGLGGGQGADTYNITLNGGTVRLDFNYTGSSGPTNGVVIDVASGVISNDGLGFQDTLNITVNDGKLEVRGTDFSDDIKGSAEDERFILRAGNDTLDGRGGNDLVRYDRFGVTAVNVDLGAGTATGTWNGGSFSHTLSNIETVRGSRDDGDMLAGDDLSNTLDGRGGDDTLEGRNGNDELIGGDGNDTLYGGDGDDTLFGGAGDDVISLGTGGAVDTADGGEGIDTLLTDLTAFTGSFTVFADLTTGMVGGVGLPDTQDFISNIENVTFLGDFDTVMTGDDTANVISTDTGNDTLYGGRGGDDLSGGASADIIDGGQGADTASGDAGNDTVSGGAGDDTLFGGSNNDALSGGTGGDSLFGGAGVDLLQGNAGTDALFGDGGNDDLKGAGGDDMLNGGFGDDMLFGGGNKDTLYGGAGDDTLEGSSAQDTLYGGDDNDLLKGGNGDDILNGGAGDDVMNGGKGRDEFTGGAGDDTMTGGVANDDFIFVDGFGHDVITDFNANAPGEQIDLSGVTEILSMNDLRTNHMAQVGADVVITDGADSITLLGVDIAKLDASDFIF